MIEIMDILNTRIFNITENYENVIFIDCRNTTNPYTWVDDMHTGKEEFKALANLFENKIGKE